MIETQELTLRAGGRTLVDKLKWQVGTGQVWAVFGPNGAGKSTLLRTVAGLRAPDGGRILLDGTDLAAWPLPRLARQRAYLAQSHSDPFSYRVIDAVLVARHPFSAGQFWEDGADHAAAREALRQLDVLHLAERDLRTLSGGERQRVAIAAMLAQDTPLLLLDEPANALDLAHQVAVMELLGGLGKTVIMVGHELNLAGSAATHALLLMGEGYWIAGPAEAVMTAPTLSRCLGHPVTALAHAGRTVFLPHIFPKAPA